MLSEFHPVFGVTLLGNLQLYKILSSILPHTHFTYGLAHVCNTFLTSTAYLMSNVFLISKPTTKKSLLRLAFDRLRCCKNK